MGSAEGTFVNGKRVNKGPINGGDEIKVGETVIRVGLSPAASNLAAAGPGDLSAVPATPATPASSAAQAGGAVPSADGVPPPAPAQSGQSAAADNSRGPIARSRPAFRQGMPTGLELRFRWGDRMIGEFFLKPQPKQSFTIGSAAGVDFEVGEANLPSDKFEVVRSDGQ